MRTSSGTRAGERPAKISESEVGPVPGESLGLGDSLPPPIEVLFPEARRRERRRRLVVAAVAVAILATSGPLLALSTGGKGHGVKTALDSNERPSVDAGAFHDEGLLAFTSEGRMYVLSGSSGRVTQVGTLASGAEEPTFSKSGRWLAYITSGKESSYSFESKTYYEAPYAPGDGQLVVSNANGSGARVISAVGSISSLRWSPTADELLVVTGQPYIGTAVSIVSPDGHVRRIASAAGYVQGVGVRSSILGAVWSPNGQFLAIGLQSDNRSTTVETISASGGKPAIWTKSTEQSEQWLIPIGWWTKQGIALWAGGNGSVPDGDGSLDGASLMLIAKPGATLRSLGSTPPIADTPAAASASGVLAVDSGGDRVAYSPKTLEVCSPTRDTCGAIREPSNVTAYDPTWNPSGSALAFVVDGASSNWSFGLSTVQTWYGDGQLALLQTGQNRPSIVSNSEGATAPQWSPNGQSVLYVADDTLYLMRKLGDNPERIAGPLLPPKEWTSTYYGGIDWRFMFSWAEN